MSSSFVGPVCYTKQFSTSAGGLLAAIAELRQQWPELVPILNCITEADAERVIQFRPTLELLYSLKQYAFGPRAVAFELKATGTLVSVDLWDTFRRAPTQYLEPASVRVWIRSQTPPHLAEWSVVQTRLEWSHCFTIIHR
jgi:hypothetical protein